MILGLAISGMATPQFRPRGGHHGGRHGGHHGGGRGGKFLIFIYL